tara:strand:- start:212 stop:544 length:333 start_codon:yes stop_codon:yes gene_type:complete
MNKHVINGIVKSLARKKFRDKTKVAVWQLIEDVGNICEAIEQAKCHYAKRHSLGQAVIQVILPKFYEAVNKGINDSPEPPQESENPNARKPILVDIPVRKHQEVKWRKTT